MRITIVSQFFEPEPAITANALAEDLVAGGHEVTVITGFPNRPGGRLFPGYRQRFGVRDAYRGSQVRRVPLIVNHDRNPVRRVANFTTFALASFYETQAGKSADVVYVYGTPMTAAIAPRIWKSLFKTPYVLHVQDLWPESVTNSGMLSSGVVNRAAEALLRPLLAWLYNGADSVIAIAPGMARALEARGVEREKISLLLNWADENNAKSIPPSSSAYGLRLVYAGNLGQFQDLETIIDAARLLQNVPDLSIEIVGDGTESSNLRQRAAGLDNLVFTGRLTRAEMPEVYRRSDFQLVTLKDLPIFRGTIPSKFQGSLMAGVPVITNVTGDVSEIVLGESLGFTTKPADPEALARTIMEAYETPAVERQRMGANARRYYENKMSRQQGVQKIAALLSEASLRRYAAGGKAANRRAGTA
ncbi:glycosyltransferase family 4 protein [Cellulosimicrobium funkei]|nr:glycosyltransferase family 4 protein [Cellulosimicrobium funkei]